MTLNAAFRKYVAAILLLASVAALVAASALLLVAVYLLVVELMAGGELHSVCPAVASSTRCASRWWAPMVGGLILMLAGGVLWPLGVARWRNSKV